MLKTRFFILFSTLFLFVTNTKAQYLWYENETQTEDIYYTNSSSGTFTTNNMNPNTNGVNTNAVSSRFVRDPGASDGFTYFDLENPIKTAITYTINLKAYIKISQSKLWNSPKLLRLYLKNTTTGDIEYKELEFTLGKTWEEFSFVFDSSDFTASGLGSGGYDQMYIGYGNGIYSAIKTTYFIDQIYGTTKQIPIHAVAKSLQGSWGARLYVRGGEDLDNYVDNKGYDYLAGAQEMISSYPSMGHVITNATNNANSHLWTLRTNPNVDAVMGAAGSVVDEEFVPSLENEQVIIDVINEFKNAGKKVILYLNSLSPGDRASDEGAAAWNNYVDTYFDGNVPAAWLNYCEGYIKRFTELGVDGYWLDTFGQYARNRSLGSDAVDSTTEEKDEFVQMIRDIAPNAIIANNYNKHSFLDENGELILVDTDGVEDTDERDYAIIKMQATNPWSDFTAGHITPLGQGAPPNSWSYEEYTVPDIEEDPITIYEDVKQTVKHLFLPIRSTWSSERSDLMFNDEQAYRFAKRITDAGGMVTFSTTTDTDGTTMEDEEAILKFVDQQLTANASVSQYIRPVGAFLVGEEQIYPWYENEDGTITDYIAIESTSFGTTTEDFSNPFQTGINTSNTVNKFQRSAGSTSRIYFDLPNPITDLSSLKISLDAFVNNANPAPVDRRIRVFLSNTTLDTKIYKQISLSSGQTWQNLEFDFSDQGVYADGYDQMAIGFANGDSSGATTIYYVDNVKGSINQFLNVTTANRTSSESTLRIANNIEEDTPTFKIYPNPVINSFKISKEFKSASIYAITGEKLLNFSGNQSSFDISNLNAGIYILVIKDSKGEKEVHRLIKK